MFRLIDMFQLLGWYANIQSFISNESSVKKAKILANTGPFRFPQQLYYTYFQFNIFTRQRNRPFHDKQNLLDRLIFYTTMQVSYYLSFSNMYLPSCWSLNVVVQCNKFSEYSNVQIHLYNILVCIQNKACSCKLQVNLYCMFK